MMDKTFAQHFAADWIAAWNSHDLERGMAAELFFFGQDGRVRRAFTHYAVG
jgi:hypothetical protein